MNIVLLESLGISPELLDQYAKKLEQQGHRFAAYERDTDPAVQIERARDADILMIANMPLSGQVIRACKNLKFIDVAFTGVDHVDLQAAKEMGVKVSNAAGYSTQAVAELAVCMMLSLLRNVPQVDERCRAGKTKDGKYMHIGVVTEGELSVEDEVTASVDAAYRQAICRAHTSTHLLQATMLSRQAPTLQTIISASTSPTLQR